MGKVAVAGWFPRALKREDGLDGQALLRPDVPGESLYHSIKNEGLSPDLIHTRSNHRWIPSFHVLHKSDMVLWSKA